MEVFGSERITTVLPGGDEDVRRIARYIVANPLRAGLGRNIGYYPYWDCIWMTDDHETPLVE